MIKPASYRAGKGVRSNPMDQQAQKRRLVGIAKRNAKRGEVRKKYS